MCVCQVAVCCYLAFAVQLVLLETGSIFGFGDNELGQLGCGGSAPLTVAKYTVHTCSGSAVANY